MSDLLSIGSSDIEVQTRLLALNNAHQVETSYLSEADWTRLIGGAFAALTIKSADALLIAFDEVASYDSPNFVWFQQRYDRFVYVDRVIVAPSARGKGIARRFYEHLAVLAGRAGHTRITCEVNTDPPNPGSDAFHAALGFEEVGDAVLTERGKAVRYLSRSISAGDYTL